MPSKDERTRAFNAARRKELARLPRIQQDTIAEVQRQLKEAATAITEQLAVVRDGLQRRQLEALQREITATLEVMRRGAVTTAQQAIDAVWAAGADLIRVPLLAGGITFTPHLNLRALVSLRGVLTDLIADISVTTINRINAQLAQVMAGVIPASDALTKIQKLLGGAARQRARMVLYTELGGAYSVASQESLEQAAATLPGLKKRWLRSGKLHPRPDHAAAHGQLRDVNKPFTVAGVAIMYPRDAKAPASHRINCGCLSVPVTDGSTWGKATVRLDPFDAATRMRIQRDT